MLHADFNTVNKVTKLRHCLVVDPCASPNTCQNGGTCSSTYKDNSFNCGCPSRYYGKRCELGKGLLQFQFCKCQSKSTKLCN